MSEIPVPEAPVIDGLHFRSYEGEADIPGMTRVMNAAVLANDSHQFRSQETVRNWIAHPSSTDPHEDVVLAFVGDELVAVAITQFEDANEGMRHYQTIGHVEPRWRRRGLGSALLPRQEARLRELARGHEHSAPPVLATWVDAPDAGARRLVERSGYQLVRTYHHMVRPSLDHIERSPVPHGIEIRSVTHVELRAVWEAMAEAFRDHFGAMDASEATFHRWRHSPRLDPDLLFAAFDGEEVAAAVQGVIQAEENEVRGYLRGWTDPIFTRRRWRRRGLASACLARTLVALRDRGMTSAQLGVDTENPNDALGLYRKHGFEPVQTETEWHKPLGSGA